MEPENKEMIAIDLGCTDPNEFVDALDQMHRSKGHEVIRDHMSPFMLKKIREDTELYKKFQDIKMECKKSYEYDRKVATMLDVNRGLTNLYNIILHLLASYKNGNDATLDAVCAAINKVEERLGMEQTDWTGGQENAAGNTEDGEGIQTDSDRTE